TPATTLCTGLRGPQPHGRSPPGLPGGRRILVDRQNAAGSLSVWRRSRAGGLWRQHRCSRSDSSVRRDLGTARQIGYGVTTLRSLVWTLPTGGAVCRVDARYRLTLPLRLPWILITPA